MRSRRLRMPAVLAAVALGAGLLAACGGSGATNGSITVYSGQHEQTTQSLVSAFEAQTGIKVKVRYNDEDSFVDEILTEGSHSPADVFYTENSPVLEELSGKGLLAPVDASTLAQTPSAYDSPTGDWVGVSARVSVLIYNPKLISASQLPTSVLQLANPRYKGQLAFAAGETDFQPIVTSVDKAYGPARTLSWLQGIAANAKAHTYPDNETIADEVNRGQVAFGVINQYYWYRLGAEEPGQIHSKLAYFAPHDPGYVLDVSGAGILKSSHHQADAQRFLAFLVSKAGQKIIGSTSISFEYPLDHGVTTSAPETPFADLQPYPITIGELGNGSTAIALLRKAGLL